jgi:cytochrome c peroxidase
LKAIAAFERTLISGRSRFDRYVFDDDSKALSDAEKRGMGLFFSARAGCAQCHSGLNFSGPLTYAGHEQTHASFANNGLYGADGRGSDDPGLFDHTHRASDKGKFRVPTLRNIALTAPYMHDGSLASLQQVVDHYASGGHRNNSQDPRVRPLFLSPAEKTDLIDFLESLTDREFIENPQFR